ncbi:MAG: HEAT repeat domain-containing protein [Cyanophyceae cyanobacterium]
MTAGESSGGEALTVEQAIANLQQREDLGLRYYAAWWLGKFRVRDRRAIDALIEALTDEADRSPDGGYPLRRNAARALGKLNEPRAVLPLIDCLNCSDYYVREAAAQALETLGDHRCIPALTTLLSGGVAAAQPVPGKPHLVQPTEAVLEALGTLAATEAISLIEPFLAHPVPKVQYAAARAMYQLTGDSRYGERLVRALYADKLPLRRSALMDLGAIGYTPGAAAIAKAPTESSLKLIALRGLLTHQLAQNQELSKQSIQVMTLMDQLL